MMPEEAQPCVFWEHIYRYSFATRYAKGQEILDIACGEGYGSAALTQAGAKRVIGVDISRETCDYARRKYGIEVRQGDATDIPIPDASVDLVVSFETIEHIAKPLEFIAECHRVLRAGGTMIISTPNRDVYRERCKENAFHLSEMDLQEFAGACGTHFSFIRYFTQHPLTAPWWSIRAFAADRWHPNPMHFINRSLRVARRGLDGLARADRIAVCRQNPVRAIIGPPRDGLCFLNQYLVRPLSARTPESPYFWLAVCTKAPSGGGHTH